MIRTNRVRHLVTACFAASAFIGSAEALAQAPPLSESIVIGAWTFRPSFEARVRSEYRRDAFQYDLPTEYIPDAVQADGYNSNLPPHLAEARKFAAPATDFWAITERIRLGLAVDRGPVTAVLKLQDSRVLGGSTFATLGSYPVAPPGPGIAPWEAYIDLHARSGRPMFLRIGRQAVQWGDGRLVSSNDFSATGRALDAARFGVELGDFDVEAMAALLAYPYIPTVGATSTSGTTGTAAGTTSATSVPQSGTQLYGLRITGHFLPLLHAELTGLARIARPPAGLFLTPGDTIVADARIYGDYRGFHYGLEGAYELGQVASYGKNRSISAPAFAGRLEWETALPWHLTFGAQGAYASGDDGTSSADKPLTRFDPILPDDTENHSRMALYAWSNLIEAGGDIAARPTEEVSIGAGYRFVGLANPKGRWVTGELLTIGASPTNESAVLGHEIDFKLRVTPWDPISFQGGYGLFLLGDGGRNILKDAGRPADMQHWGYLQVVVKAP